MMKITARPEVFTKARILKGYTQRDLADRARVSHSYISMLERSLKTAGPAVAKRLSEVLEHPMEELFKIE